MRRLASSNSRLRPLIPEGCERRPEDLVVARWRAVDPAASESARVIFNNEFSMDSEIGLLGRGI
jgi:hypothetical protein